MSESSVDYWKARFEAKRDECENVRKRNELLEDRLLAMADEAETSESRLQMDIDDLKKNLSASQLRVEQLETACFRYKSDCVAAKSRLQKLCDTQSKPIPNLEAGEEPSLQSSDSDGPTPEVFVEPEDPIMPQEALSRVLRAEEFSPKAASSPHVFEYHRLPILSRDEGFIYGFRWSKSSAVQQV